MTRTREKVEKIFEGLAEKIYDNRYKTIVLMLLFMATLLSQINKIQLDTSIEGFLHKDDVILTEYDDFKSQFGRDELAIIALSPRKVFDFEFLSTLKQLHEDLRDNLPYLDDITSLINARNTRGKGDVLIVEDLFERWPKTEAELLEIKKTALANDLYRDLLISEDGTMTTIILKTKTYSSSAEGQENSLEEFKGDLKEAHPAKGKASYLTDEENSIFVKEIKKIVDNHDFKDTRILFAGTPVVTDFMKHAMTKDMRRFMLAAIVTIAAFLFIMFRRISGVLLPLLVVMISVLSTISLLPITGTTLKMATQIIPSFLLAVGVGDAIHLLVIFYRKYDRCGNKRLAISYSMGHSGLAILMTSLTTAGGLLSFSTAEIAPVAELGRFAAGGVILALIYTIFLLPALLAVFPLKPFPDNITRKKFALFDGFLDFSGNTATTHPKAVLTVALVTLIVSVVGIAKIRVSHNAISWFPKTNDVRIATETLDRDLKGTTSLEVSVDTGKEDGLYDPDLMQRLEKSQAFMESYDDGEVDVGKAFSVTTVLKETNRALHGDQQAFYRVPNTDKLIAQELFLFENSGTDDLEDYTDSLFSKARFTIKVPFIDAIAYTKFVKSVKDHFKSFYPDQRVVVTGMVAIFSRVITSAIHSMSRSYIYALIVISILMMLLIGKIKIGLVSMVPNIYPIIVMIGIMGWAGIPMDLFCMLIGSISIGLAVDDTIHFMHNFRRYYERSGDPKEAIFQTFQTTGRAMLITTYVLSIGFFIFMFAEMRNIFFFGMITGCTLVLALLSDYFIAPALMMLFNAVRPVAVSKEESTELQVVEVPASTCHEN
ncbi:MAG: efflux RND transporter permease subunit [Desulfobacteraceae bacterium]|jgi:predicted RND superfamily exporter protein